MDQPVPEGARTFAVTGDAYHRFMGRYSEALAEPFADLAGASGGTALDVGCGPGALTARLAARLGAGSVSAVDPSPPFVAACAARLPGVDVRQGRAEDLPFPDGAFDRTLSQLALHFVDDAPATLSEMARVTVPGGGVAACVWASRGMDMLNAYWDAVGAVDGVEAPRDGHDVRHGEPGDLRALLSRAGLRDVDETTIDVTSRYEGFDELWDALLHGIGPAGAHAAALPAAARDRVRTEMRRRLSSPAGAFALTARARAGRGTVPG